jgi:diguanylate cyclase (GGDEF)-like protein
MASQNREHPKAVWKISLPSLLIVPFIAQVFSVVSVVGYLSYRHGEQAIENLTDQLMIANSQRVEQMLIDYLAPAHLVNQINHNALQRGELKLDVDKIDPRRDQYLWQSMHLFQDLIWTNIGTKEGNRLGVLRPEDGSALQIAVSNQSTNYFVNYYQTDPQGQRQQLVKTENHRQYDPRKRPWYQQAVAAQEPIWTDIYAGFTPGRIMISAAHPLYDQQGKLLGVSCTDISIFDIKTFLVKNRVSASGHVFLIDRSGQLVASSNEQEIAFRTIKDQKPQRVSAFTSEVAITRAVTHALRQKVGDFHTIKSQQTLQIMFERQRRFIQVVPFSQDKRGLNWLIVTSIPESDVMSEIHAARHMTIGFCFAALAGVILLNILLSHRLAGPIRNLSQASQQISQGNFNHPVQSSNIQELSILADSFQQMSQEIQQSRYQLEEYSRSLEHQVEKRTQELKLEIDQRLQAEASLREANQQLQQLAYIDGLTQISNRRWFDQQLKREWFCSKRSSKALSVILCDVDYFKQYNDTYGHQAGDECLQDIATAISRAVRRPSDLVARYGGEEFVVLLPNTNLAGAMAVAEAIQSMLQQLKRPHRNSQVSDCVSMSFGLASAVPTEDRIPDSLLADADRSLYRAKAQGRNRIDKGELY